MNTLQWTQVTRILGSMVCAAVIACVPPADTDAGTLPTADAGPVVEEEASVRIGPDGGRILLEDGAELIVPAGALREQHNVTFSRISGGAVAGYALYSSRYRIDSDPAVAELDADATLRLPFSGDGRRAVLFWSRSDASGYERRGGTVEGDFVVGALSHFSDGFVADGISYEDPADLSCVRTRVRDVLTSTPAVVAVAVAVEDCQGRPVTGLEADRLIVKEDGAALSSEAAFRILPDDGVREVVFLALDMSSSTTPQLTELIAGARAFVHEAQEVAALPVRIGILLFAGEAGVTVWQRPTLIQAELDARLDDLAAFVPLDPSSTNLYGAVVDGLAELRAERAKLELINRGGIVTSGSFVLFTDGTDTAARATLAEVLAARAAGDDELTVVGLAGSDFDPVALAALLPDVLLIAPSPDTLSRELEAAAARIAGRMKRLYLVGYCSPKRTGTHVVTVEVGGATTSTAEEAAFVAEGFGPGCTATYFDGACAGYECGGLACGGCDERIEQCGYGELPTSADDFLPPTHCYDTCATRTPQVGGTSGPFCGGVTITNTAGWEQTCPDLTERTMCMEGSATCENLLQSYNHCGDCDDPCAPYDGTMAEDCIDGECVPRTVCPAGACDVAGCAQPADCDGDVTNGCESNLASDSANCGACGFVCGGTCGGPGLAGICDGAILVENMSAAPHQLVGDRLYYGAWERDLVSGETRLVGSLDIVDGDTGYWAANGTIRARDMATLDDVIIASDPPGETIERIVAATPEHVIFTVYDESGNHPLYAVLKTPPTSGSNDPFFIAQTASIPIVAHGSLYWVQNDGSSLTSVQRASPPAFAPKTFVVALDRYVDPEFGFDKLLAADGTHLYWSDLSPIGGEHRSASVLRRSASLGPVEKIADGALPNMAVYGDYLYGEGGDWLSRISTSGGAFEPVVPSSSGYVVHDDTVYFVAKGAPLDEGGSDALVSAPLP